MTIIDKTFDPAEIEARLYAHWEASGAFRPERPDAVPFTIVIPPPNVTGSLHIGHALDNTLQDVLIRYHRLKGRDALWVVGTDHAGIATQMVVERAIAGQGLKRSEMGREAFLAHVWEWKATSGSTITRQLRRLGASCDWAHERFTMDEGFSKAVTKVFVDLHAQGLLYRAKRLVNWDPAFKTAISDLEVEYREIDGHLWHFRYPLEDGSGFIAIATTRPETILGDGAVAVNPGDERYRHLVGTYATLPVMNRRLPIVADDYVEADFGSGAVKITAAHDFNDFALAARHPDAHIPLISLMNPDGTMSGACPPDYRGLTREAARQKVIADFDALGLLDKVEPHRHQVPYGDRSGVVIEPYLTDQWYVDAATLAAPALAAVRDGRTQFVPKTWEKTYFNWMENIQPWCVSRQLWWGHRIPAWYGPAKTEVGIRWGGGRENIGDPMRFHDHIFIAESEADAAKQAHEFYKDVFDIGEVKFVDTRVEASQVLLDSVRTEHQVLPLFRDEDVLDTWFSSALWPFGTLGWPPSPAAIPANAGTHLSTPPEMGLGVRRNDERASGHDNAPLLARHYPGDVLVTGFDIIFFWVARMMMQGLHFMNEVPFRTVYCHGLVRDASGAKMSKSKGNTIDPLVLIDKYGADALRFTLTAMESQGRDIKLDERRVEGYRNFATKLWNAARFCQSNGIGDASVAGGIGGQGIDPPAATHAVNRWIIGEVATTAAALDAAIAAFRFDDYAETIYQFAWSRFCDWYLELTKPLLAEGADAGVAAETRAVAGWALDQILVLLHPVMPFITEELWHKLGDRPYDLILAAWPTLPVPTNDAKDEIDWLIGLVAAIRSARTEVNVPPGARLGYAVADADATTQARLTTHAAALAWLARVAPGPVAGGALQVVHGDATYALAIGDVVDLAAERARLEKSAVAAEKDRDGARRTARIAGLRRARQARGGRQGACGHGGAERGSRAAARRAGAAGLGR